MSDHFDGRRFFNPNGAPAGKSLWQLLRWKFGGGRVRWPRQVANRPFPPPPGHVAEGEVAATFIGHATWLLRTARGVVLTDPLWSEHAGPCGRLGPRRARRPGLPFGQLPPVDVVLVSHNHYDHLDVPTLCRLDRIFRPRFVTTLGNGRYFRRRGLRDVEELDWWQTARPRDGLDVTLTPAQHFSARTPFDHNHTLWGGFYLIAGPLRVYFAADTGFAPEIFRAVRDRLGAPDLALLPIGAYEPRWFMKDSHMDPDEAVRAHRGVGARRSVGMHFGTVQLTDEAINDPPRRLRAALERYGVPPEQFTVPEVGEMLLVRAATDR